jgi:hypothetical protein
VATAGAYITFHMSPFIEWTWFTGFPIGVFVLHDALITVGNSRLLSIPPDKEETATLNNQELACLKGDFRWPGHARLRMAALFPGFDGFQVLVHQPEAHSFVRQFENGG